MDRKELKPEEMDRVSGGATGGTGSGDNHHCSICHVPLSAVDISKGISKCASCREKEKPHRLQLRIHT